VDNLELIMPSEHPLHMGVLGAFTAALYAMLKYVDPLIGTANGGSF
jgi:hypothetical protein